MNSTLDRRRFLTGSLAASAVGGTSLIAAGSTDSKARAQRDFYEVRAYRCPSAEKQSSVVAYVEGALQPALNRLGAEPVGVFAPVDSETTDVYVVVTYPSLDLITRRNGALESDSTYQEAAAPHFAHGKDDPPYTRIESRLLHSFAGMPAIQPPKSTIADRLLELRIYESPNEHAARLKVEMFNEGEIDIMKDVDLGPVFFGETLFAGDVPNLTYLLSADSEDDHQAHWKAFSRHPEWQRMKKIDRYKGTVSKIVSVKLAPTKGSQI